MMGRGATCGEEQGTNYALIRRNLCDSVYVWACGEKADDDDDDPTLSDRLIGWLILCIQAFAYIMLTLLARTSFNSDGDTASNGSRQSGDLLPAVTGAMYLLFASTAHDLRAGFSLLVDGARARHRTLGFGLLVVYGIMITTAMTVLASTSEDSASVLLNAVAVLFIADLDENALKLLATVPQKWRLFWAIESIGISFALAMIAIFHIGGASPLLEENNKILKLVYESWTVWCLNPTGVTLVSLLLSSILQGVCDVCTEICEGVDYRVFGVVSAEIFHSAWTAIVTRAKERFGHDRFFNAFAFMWFSDGVVGWLNFQVGVGNEESWPVLAFEWDIRTAAGEERTLKLTSHRRRLLCMNAILATGLAAKVVTVILRRYASPSFCSGVNRPRDSGGSCKYYCATSLLVGWGIEYWLFSFLGVLASSWHGGAWSDPPLGVTIFAYVIIPCFLLAGVLTVADDNFLGARFGAYVQPTVAILKNRERVEYWVMITLFRDILFAWAKICALFRETLSYWG